MYHFSLNFLPSPFSSFGVMHLFGYLRTWTTPHGQVDPSMWNSTASSLPQHPGIGGFVNGCDPTLQSVQQQQAQFQVQIELLRQQNLLLNSKKNVVPIFQMACATLRKAVADATKPNGSTDC